VGLEFEQTPWGEKAYLLNGTLSHSSKTRGVFAESEDQPHLVEAIDGVLRRLGGTARRWRFDRMSTVVSPNRGRLLASSPKSPGTTGWRSTSALPGAATARGRSRSRTTSARSGGGGPLASPTWPRPRRRTTAFRRPSATNAGGGGAPSSSWQGRASAAAAGPTLPLLPGGGAQRLRLRPVAFRGNLYGVGPGLVGATVKVRLRLGSDAIAIVSATGSLLAEHRREPAGAGVIRRLPGQREALEAAVLSARPPCRRKENRPPGLEAVAAARKLLDMPNPDVTVDLERYARLAGVRP
jgi:hypothetical protein